MTANQFKLWSGMFYLWASGLSVGMLLLDRPFISAPILVFQASALLVLGIMKISRAQAGPPQQKTIQD